MLRISSLSETGLVSADGAGALFLRSAGGNGAVPVAGRRAFPFPPIRSGISAPPLRHGHPAVVMAILLSSWPASTGHLFRQAIIFGPFCWLSGHFLPPGRHFCPFLLAQRSFLSADPSFSALFAGLTVVMAGPDRPSLPPSHHFRPILLAQRSYLSAGPSFSAHFVGLTVVMAGLDRPSLPPIHHFRPFLST